MAQNSRMPQNRFAASQKKKRVRVASIRKRPMSRFRQCLLIAGIVCIAVVFFGFCMNFVSGGKFADSALIQTITLRNVWRGQQNP